MYYDDVIKQISKSIDESMEPIRRQFAEMHKSMMPLYVETLREQLNQINNIYSDSFKTISHDLINSTQFSISDPLKETVQQMQKIVSDYASPLKFDTFFDGITFKEDTITISTDAERAFCEAMSKAAANDSVEQRNLESEPISHIDFIYKYVHLY